MSDKPQENKKEAEEEKREAAEEKKRLENYKADYIELMDGNSDKSISNRLRWLAFAVADPSCPLQPLSSVGDVHKLISLPFEAKEKVHREMYKMSHALGLLKGQPVKLDPRIPGPNEWAELVALRKQIELSALFRIHHETHSSHRDAAIRRLRDENSGIGGLKTRTEDVEELISTKPDVGFRAERFWIHDTEFHISPLKILAAQAESQSDNEKTKRRSKKSEKGDEPVQVSILRMILTRTRLSDSNRRVIIQRIGKSFAEHEKIIDAVASEPIDSDATDPKTNKVIHDYLAGRNFSTSEQLIIKAVEEHYSSFGKDFGGGKGEREGESGENL